MRYTLMNRSYETAEVTIKRKGKGEYDFFIDEILDKDRLPFAVQYAPDHKMTAELARWFRQRSIPDYRVGITRLQQAVGEDLFYRSLTSRAQSLTDRFWLRKKGSHETWDQVSYAINGWSYDTGNFILGATKIVSNKTSPDYTVNGRLGKVWRKQGDNTFLLKLGAGRFRTEPYSEAAVSEILRKTFHLPFVSYRVDIINHQPCSICKNFTDDNLEFITAGEICRSAPRQEGIPIDLHLREQCHRLGIPGYNHFLDELHRLDYITGNQDRNLGNYGFMRNVNTLEFIGPAPIFDNGAAIFGQDEIVNNFEINTIDHLSDQISDIAAIQHLPEFNFNSIVKDVCKDSDIPESMQEQAAESMAKRMEDVEKRIREAQRRYTRQKNDILEH